MPGMVMRVLSHGKTVPIRDFSRPFSPVASGCAKNPGHHAPSLPYETIFLRLPRFRQITPALTPRPRGFANFGLVTIVIPPEFGDNFSAALNRLTVKMWRGSVIGESGHEMPGWDSSFFFRAVRSEECARKILLATIRATWGAAAAVENAPVGWLDSSPSRGRTRRDL